MFDGLFEIIAKLLSVFYSAVPNYAIAIAMLTLVVMVATTPFTLKGTRSMMQMQRLQPELRRLQIKYKDDRQKLNEEMMAFYRENQINPLGGCLPLLLQMPIFIVLFNVVKGLTAMGDDGTFAPKYLDHGTALFRDLDSVKEMIAFGVDLSESASTALSSGFIHGLPHVLMVAIVAVSSYFQQKQIQGRNPDAEVPPQQKMLMRLMPAMFVVFAFASPAGLVVYFVVSNLYRIGMQAYITRTMYHGEDSLGAQVRRAAAEAKQLSEEHGAPEVLPRLGRRAKESVQPAAPSAKEKPAGPAVPTSRTGAQNRSKKKKKRR